MRTTAIAFGSLVCALCLFGIAAQADEPAAKSGVGKVRVGTYDSRAMAAAYTFSPAYNASEEPKKAAEFNAELQKAKGDEKRTAEVNAKYADLVKANVLRHKQMYSTAPVDDLLVHIKAQMPEIAKAAGVGPIVSKWDKAALAKYKGAEFVDVTMAMVQAFQPTEQMLKLAVDVQKKDPIPLEKAEKMDWTKE